MTKNNGATPLKLDVIKKHSLDLYVFLKSFRPTDVNTASRSMMQLEGEGIARCIQGLAEKAEEFEAFKKLYPESAREFESAKVSNLLKRLTPISDEKISAMFKWLDETSSLDLTRLAPKGGPDER